jgi:hypothetical protein
MMRARRASATGHPPGAQTHPAQPGTSGAASTRAATGPRLAARLAVAIGLLTVGLGAGVLLLWWPVFGEEDLPQRITEALGATAGVPFSVMGALICARRPGNRIGWSPGCPPHGSSSRRGTWRMGRSTAACFPPAR